ncbi:hypothetical protein ANN_14507, partial [Periplaneta americana]
YKLIRIQTEGLSGEYLEDENTELRSQFHFLVALAFVPENIQRTTTKFYGVGVGTT